MREDGDEGPKEGVETEMVSHLDPDEAPKDYNECLDCLVSSNLKNGSMVIEKRLLLREKNGVVEGVVYQNYLSQDTQIQNQLEAARSHSPPLFLLYDQVYQILHNVEAPKRSQQPNREAHVLDGPVSCVLGLRKGNSLVNEENDEHSVSCFEFDESKEAGDSHCEEEVQQMLHERRPSEEMELKGRCDLLKSPPIGSFQKQHGEWSLGGDSVESAEVECLRSKNI